MKDQYDLGIYDSGIGGLTIAYALLHRYPTMRILYYADTAYLPLGDKSPEVIKERTLNAVEYFKENNCKALLFACNTVSTICYDYLTQVEETIPIFNVVDTLLKGLQDQDVERVLLFSTVASARSGVFERKLRQLNVESIQVIGAPKLVPYIEARNVFKEDRIRDYLFGLKKRVKSEPEAIIFGCTHFPIIRHLFKETFHSEMYFYDAILPSLKTITEKISFPEAPNPQVFTEMEVRCSLGSSESLIAHYLKIAAYESAYL